MAVPHHLHCPVTVICIGQIGLDAPPPPARTTTMRLTPVDPGGEGEGEATVLTAAWQNISSFQAHFAVPPTLRPAEYAVSVCNGQGGYTSMDSFIHPMQPHVRTIVVKPVPVAPRVFALARPHGKNRTTGTLIDSTASLKWGLAQAAALGAGKPAVLQLQRGWYVNIPARSRTCSCEMQGQFLRSGFSIDFFADPDQPHLWSPARPRKGRREGSVEGQCMRDTVALKTGRSPFRGVRLMMTSSSVIRITPRVQLFGCRYAVNGSIEVPDQVTIVRMCAPSLSLSLSLSHPRCPTR